MSHNSRDLTIEAALADPMIGAALRADKVDPQDFEALLRSAAHTLATRDLASRDLASRAAASRSAAPCSDLATRAAASRPVAPCSALLRRAATCRAHTQTPTPRPW